MNFIEILTNPTRKQQNINRFDNELNSYSLNTYGFQWFTNRLKFDFSCCVKSSLRVKT